MSRTSLSHHADHVVLRELHTCLDRENRSAAEALAWLGEADARRLYLPAGYPSMYAWCVGARNLSEDAAAKRIQAARIARRFPLLLDALADGRLHLSGIVLLAPHLSEESVEALVALAARKTKAQIETLLAERSVVRASAAPLISGNEHAPGHVAPHVYARVTPLGGERYRLDGVLDRELHDLLREAQEVLGHAVPSGTLVDVLRHCVRRAVTEARRRQQGAAAKPRAPRAASGDPREIPMHVRRAVWARDGGQCTFESDTGHRCACRRGVELDHVRPVAKGGGSTEANLRLRCRAHNQFTAEREFGAAFMRGRREQAKRRAAEARVAKARELARARERAAAGVVAGADGYRQRPGDGTSPSAATSPGSAATNPCAPRSAGSGP